jgi:NADH:ubiquinone oxidoreductase subunit 6 (subunit J)
MERASKVFYTLLALFALALCGGGLRAAGGEGLAFGLFAFLTLGGGLVCVFERSVVSSAFALLATFSGTAGLFLLLGADFLAMAQILIYVGGILVLLVFGILLTGRTRAALGMERPERLWVGAGIGGVLLAGLLLALFSTDWGVARTLAEPEPTTRELGRALLDPERYLVPFELVSVLLLAGLVGAAYLARRRRDT